MELTKVGEKDVEFFLDISQKWGTDGGVRRVFLMSVSQASVSFKVVSSTRRTISRLVKAMGWVMM